MAKVPKAKKTFVEKVQEEMPDFVGEVVGLSVDDLNKRLAAIAKASQENDENQEKDEDLAKAKLLAKELGDDYREPRKTLKKKTKYIVALIKEKGGT